MPGHFGDLDLERMVAVGAVEPTRARLWARAPSPGTEELVITPEDGRERRVRVEIPDGPGDHTAAFTYPDDFPGEAPLAPGTTHHFRVGALGAGGFVTPPPPGTSAPVRFALLSCHEPFDARGAVDLAARRMMRVLAAELRAPDVAFAVLAGDQVYADHPPRESLFEKEHFARVAPAGRASVLECTRAEVRALYQRRYRSFWGFPEWRQAQAQLATYPILDDHEIVDNWGSLVEHAHPRWANVRDGALDAFHDYQASRVLRRRGSSFDHGFTWGRVGVYVTDLRSQRRAMRGETLILGDGQHERLAAFLAGGAELDAIVVVISVPILHISEWAATAVGYLSHGDAADRWTFAPTLGERDRLLRLLHAHGRAHPRQRIVMVGGDIHVGCAFRLEWRDGTPPVLQLTSSAVTNVIPGMIALPARNIPYTVRDVRGEGVDARASLIPAVDGGNEQPFAGLNFGLVDLEPDGAGGMTVRFRLITEDGCDPPAARTVYDTGAV